MKITFVNVNGVTTRYLHAGTGSPLLLIHGVGVSADCFLRNIDLLAEKHTVITPDLLGHGFTDAIDFQNDPPQKRIVQHLAQLMDNLGHRKYDVLGSSYGGSLAALLYFERPDQVKNLIIVGSASVFHPVEEQIAALRGALANASKAMTDPSLESCRSRMAAICFDPKAVDEAMLPVQLTSYALPDRFEAYKATINGQIRAAADPSNRIYPRLEELDVRSLVIAAREDIRAQWQLHVEGSRRMPNARHLVFEKCGHMPFMEHPEKFNRLVAGFLDGADVGN